MGNIIICINISIIIWQPSPFLNLSLNNHVNSVKHMYIYRVKHWICKNPNTISLLRIAQFDGGFSGHTSPASRLASENNLLVASGPVTSVLGSELLRGNRTGQGFLNRPHFI